MATVTRFVRRLLPALVMASSVTLLSAGVFNWAPPQTLGDLAFATPSADPGDPILDVTPQPTTGGGPTTPLPTSSPNPSADCWWPGCPYGPYATPIPPAPGPTGSSDVAVTTGDSPPTRIVVPSLGIDLPVVAGNTSFPLCDVAQYLFGFSNPGQPGTTYLYGHARAGMFLPLLDESQEPDNGASMIGALVNLYTADLKLHIYQIDVVKQHATDLSLAYDLDPGQHRLIMQTSEGPHGTIPKLQVAATPIGIYTSTAAEALPTPHPRVCH
jgi:hypothetical protein